MIGTEKGGRSGYVVSCDGGLLRRIGCKPLVAGQSLRGSVEGGKLSLPVANKIRNYRIETSAYIGRISQDTGKGQPTTPPAPLRVVSDEGSVGPRPKPTVQVESPNDTGPSSAPTGEAEVPARTGKVMFTSDPQGADIYVDGKFVGNTPSLIELAPGSRSVRIDVQGRKPWTRVLDVTAGNKVTIQAVLATEQ